MDLFLIFGLNIQRLFGEFSNTKYLNLDKLQDVSGTNLYTIMYTMSFTKGWATLNQI